MKSPPGHLRGGFSVFGRRPKGKTRCKPLKRRNPIAATFSTSRAGLAAVVAAQTDERKCFELIDSETKAALKVLAGDAGGG